LDSLLDEYVELVMPLFRDFQNSVNQQGWCVPSEYQGPLSILSALGAQSDYLGLCEALVRQGLDLDAEDGDEQYDLFCQMFERIDENLLRSVEDLVDVVIGAGALSELAVDRMPSLLVAAAPAQMSRPA